VEARTPKTLLGAQDRARSIATQTPRLSWEMHYAMSFARMRAPHPALPPVTNQSPSPRRRLLLGITVAVALAVPVACPAIASATATGCTSNTFPSCVGVFGSQLWVAYATATLESPPAFTWRAVVPRSYVGRFHIWGPGFNMYSPVKKYKTSLWGYFTGQMFEFVWRLHRFVRPGPVCAVWLSATRQGFAQAYGGPACVSVTLF
jgi:hypothetical protein